MGPATPWFSAHPVSRVDILYIQAYAAMRFEWDPEKSERNYRERRFDFAFAGAESLPPGANPV